MRSRIHLTVLGLAGIALYVGMWQLSYQFNWGEGYRHRPILTYLAIYGGLFACYAGAAALALRRTRGDVPLFWIMIAFGLLFRAALMPAQQIQEDDVYRYLWDGKVAAHGINPYKFSPAEVTRFKEFMIRDPGGFDETYDTRSVAELAVLYDLKWETPASLVYQERINHPEVATIYPPLAQLIFLTGHTIQPDSILTLRLLFLIFDLAALIFIVKTLDALGMNRLWAVIWFWCPLVIKETYNSTHLDIIGIAMLAGVLYFVVRRSYTAASALLALSVVGKLYPAVLLPLLIQQQWRKTDSRTHNPWLHCGVSLAVFGGIVAAFYLPFMDIGSQTFSGLREYATRWQQNDSLFALILGFFRLFVESKEPVPFSHDLPSLLAKITVALMLGAAMAYLLFRRKGNGAEEGTAESNGRAQLEPLFYIMALVFLLSPVQNPWYLCWLVPFLCIFPLRSGILLTGLVGLYYLDFYWDYQELQSYAAWTPWLEYTPFYLLLAWEIRRRTGPGARTLTP